MDDADMLQATMFSNCSTTKNWSEHQREPPKAERANRLDVVPQKNFIFVAFWNYSDLCKPGIAQRICDHDGYFLSSAAVEKCDIWSSQSAMQAT